MNNFPPAADAACEPGDQRFERLAAWLSQSVRMPFDRVDPASGDASFRRYFRVVTGGTSLVAMDAPPSAEPVGPFLDVARLLEHAGVTVPRVHAVDVEQGFVLLDDLGNQRYRDELNAETADGLYGDAIDALVRFQRAIDVQHCARPPYDEALLRRELSLFKEWFLRRDCGIALDGRDNALYDETVAILVRSALEQPRVFVHRDYHSRNLMVCRDGNPGILDFQDAVVGPITYDLVSLLRDCYINWPDPRVDRWVDQYVTRARQAGLPVPGDPEHFRRWFDLMGMQRHLKAIGIFSRLALRDGKLGYLEDIPRTLAYVSAVCARYEEFSAFGDFLGREVGDRPLRQVAA